MSLAVKQGRYTSQGGMRGNVRSGDPGLLGGILGGLGGLITGGPAGAVAGAVAGWKGGGSSRPPSRGIVGPQIPPGRGPGRTFPLPGGSRIRFRPGDMFPGGAPGFQVEGDPNVKLACPSGYHPNKSSYWLQDGTYVEKGTRCVKNRRRNPMNPRALDRALSRLNSAKKVQNKLRKYSTNKYTAAGTKKDC